MAHDAHGRGGNDLVKLKAKKSLEPSPEEEVGLVEDHPRDEYWTEKADDRCADGAVGDDHGDQSGKNAQNNLHRIGAEKRVRLGE